MVVGTSIKKCQGYELALGADETLCEFIYLNLNPICILCTNTHFYAKLNIVVVVGYI